MSQNHRRRSQVIVNKPLQGRIVVASMWLPCLFLMISSVLLAVYSRQLHDEAMMADVDLPSILPAFLASISFIVLATVFTVVHGVRLSHRIAGPVVNFDRTITRFIAGDRSARIKLRERDLLVEAADQVNRLLAWAEQNLPAQEGEGAHGEDQVEAHVEEAVTTGADI